jgi:cob(I)alamin adenosyltransferase
MDREDARGLLMCYTGAGKGKTTAALGSLMRAYGRGLKVIMFQFIKKKGSEFGEHIAARKLGIEIIPLGDGFTWRSEDIEKDSILALECWDICKDEILNGDYDMIILDEITYPITFGWLKADEVLSVIERRPKWMHIIITGRDANEKLIEASDLVTQMMEVKHHFRDNVPQQSGIEC